MAKQPHRDDDKAKKAADELVSKGGPKTPVPGAKPPKTPVPNMSLDEPVEDAEEVEEILEAEEAEEFEVVEEVEAELISGDDEAEEVLSAEDAVEVTGSSAVLAEAVPMAHPVAAPASDVNLMDLFEDAPPAPSSAVLNSMPTPDPEAEMMSRLATASAPLDETTMPLEDIAAAEIAEAAPASDVIADEAIFEEAIAEPVEAMPASDAVAEAMPVSDVVEAEEVAEAMPASDVFAAEEVAEEVTEAESAVKAAEAPSFTSEADHAPSESAVVAASEAGEAAPESAVVASAEAPSPSEIVAAEGVLFEETVGEAQPASEIHSGEVLEEVAEFVEDEASSATRKAEAVLEDDEVAEAEEVISAVEAFEEVTEEGEEPISAVGKAGSGAKKRRDKTAAFEQTIAFEPPSGKRKKSDDDDMLVTEEELDESTPASAVDLGEMPARKGSSASGIDKVAEELESGVEVEPEEAVEAEEAESAGSVEFDELLDDLGDSSQEIPASKKKKTVGKLAKQPTEMDDDATEAVEAEFEEAAEAEEEETPKSKKGKKATKVKATGDDIDLNDLFDEGEKPAEEAEAEAGEAYAEEAGAEEAVAEEPEEPLGEDVVLDDETEKPTKKDKKGKKPVIADQDDETPVDEDDEELAGKKKKKGKKDKEKATVGSDTRQPSGLLRIFIGMVLATIIIVGAAGAGIFLAPNQVVDVAIMAGADKPKTPTPPKPHVETPLEKAHQALDKGDFAEVVTLLADAKDDAEFAVRGEARWLEHLKKGGPLDKEAPDVKAALADLKGKNDVLHKNIEAQIAAAVREKDLNDQVAKANASIGGVAKQLTAAKTELAKANSANDDLMKQLTAATDDKAKAEKTIDAVADALVKSKLIQDKGNFNITLLDKLLKGLTDDRATLATVTTQLKDTEAAHLATSKDRAELLQTVADAFKELVDPKTVKPGTDPRMQLVDAARIARQNSESPFAIPLAMLALSQGYQERLDSSIIFLQDRGQSNPKQLEAITRETDWVLDAKSKTDDEAKAKARYLQGLALRNQEKFAEARTAFEDALNRAKTLPKAGAWTKDARKSLAEITEPNAYYLGRIERLREENNHLAAVNEANAALKVMPNQPVLNLQRGLARLEVIRGQGPKIAPDAEKAIRADADAAGKDAKLAADSAYVLGLLEEELQNWPEAEKQIKKAIETAEASDSDSDKYRVVRARLLLRDRDAAPVIPAPPAEEKKKDDKDAALPTAHERVLVMHPWTPFIVSAVLAQQPADQIEDPETLARIKEAIEEANKLINSKNDKLKGEGYLALGKALTKLGQRTDGLKAYAEGLKLIYPGIKTKELQDMIAEHPAFQQPDLSNIPNPVMSERHFGEGLHHYWANRYPEAEQQFKQAVKFYDKDARYLYFLGLAQLGQKTTAKRDAADFSFIKGARLEANAASTNPLVVRDINASLERVQGELRQKLNSYRYKVSSGPAEQEVK